MHLPATLALEMISRGLPMPDWPVGSAVVDERPAGSPITIRERAALESASFEERIMCLRELGQNELNRRLGIVRRTVEASAES